MEQPELPSFPLFFSFLVFFLLIDFFRSTLGFLRSRSRSPRAPPGPWKLVGSIHCFVGRLPFRDLARRYGPLMLPRIGELDVAVSSSREAAEEILKNRDPSFASRPGILAAEILISGCSDMVFSPPYGPYWTQLCMLRFTELLSPRRIQIFACITKEDTLNMMREVAAAEGPVNLSEKIFTLSNTVASRATFGKRSEHQDRFIPVGQLGGLCVTDRFPSLKLLDVLTGARFRLQRLHRHLDEIIEEHEAKAEARSGRPVDEVEDLVDVPLRVRDEPFPMTVGRMKAIIFVSATCHLLVVIIHLLGDVFCW